jgi:hypothetical protein
MKELKMKNIIKSQIKYSKMTVKNFCIKNQQNFKSSTIKFRKLPLQIILQYKNHKMFKRNL